ncbi:hypothetical protein HDU91_005343 [Kappamyces sp. JEL0680]|nr:hypothetical protein HDU91_005343 [Kappamyces sp. JEL0680]
MAHLAQLPLELLETICFQYLDIVSYFRLRSSCSSLQSLSRRPTLAPGPYQASVLQLQSEMARRKRRKQSRFFIFQPVFSLQKASASVQHNPGMWEFLLLHSDICFQDIFAIIEAEAASPSAIPLPWANFDLLLLCINYHRADLVLVLVQALAPTLNVLERFGLAWKRAIEKSYVEGLQAVVQSPTMDWGVSLKMLQAATTQNRTGILRYLLSLPSVSIPSLASAEQLLLLACKYGLYDCALQLFNSPKIASEWIPELGKRGFWSVCGSPFSGNGTEHDFVSIVLLFLSDPRLVFSGEELDQAAIMAGKEKRRLVVEALLRDPRMTPDPSVSISARSGRIVINSRRFVINPDDSTDSSDEERDGKPQKKRRRKVGIFGIPYSNSSV